MVYILVKVINRKLWAVLCMAASCGNAIFLGYLLDEMFGTAKAAPDWLKIVAMCLVMFPAFYSYNKIVEAFPKNNK